MTALNQVYDFLGGKEYLQEHFGYVETGILDVSIEFTVYFSVLGGIRGRILYQRHPLLSVPDILIYVDEKLCYSYFGISPSDCDKKAMFSVVSKFFG
jgi:hypothetical protein